ncbi:MAG: dihydroorotate dehydrogenase electron transfer subunit [Methanomicrobiales archaeon]|nr:dihydroorotate dehydrogenase electron transfer subunit [Methanomicrobiales archaeon]
MGERLPIVTRIERVIKETPTIRTFVFSHEFPFKAGQFVMVWVPGVDEIPMALSSSRSISVQNVGEATEALFSLGPGDPIGLRGPLGNSFPEEGEILAICGGIGAAPLLPFARSDHVNTFLLGARTEEELPFVDLLDECTNLLLATDDGSMGFEGRVTDLMAESHLVNLDKFDVICTCGPEAMMKTVWDRLAAAGRTDRGYFSLQRYMKCGIGVCGSCCIDPEGLRPCTEGPVFRGDRLAKSEFGYYARDGSGRKKPFPGGQ